MKEKSCIEKGCNYKGQLTGYQRCNRCYTKLLREFQIAKANDKTKFRNLREYVANKSTYIPRETDNSNAALKSLKALLVKLTHNYVKDSYMINGKVQCYTCELWFDRKEIQCGHFKSSKTHPNTRYDHKWLRSQCISCNCEKGGMDVIFETKLRIEMGDDAVDNHIKESHKNKQWSLLEIQNKINNIKLLSKNIKHD